MTAQNIIIVGVIIGTGGAFSALAAHAVYDSDFDETFWGFVIVLAGVLGIGIGYGGWLW